MLYLNTNHIKKIGIQWNETTNVIRKALQIFDKGDVSQPIKPYLRFKKPTNRIISMPAYIGGDFEIAGIKWIASFPKNIDLGIPRAHSVTILNDCLTGRPLTMINSAMVSCIRTASVSSLMVQEYHKIRKHHHMIIGIVGFGPIGQFHLEMLYQLLGNQIAKVYLYDSRKIDVKTIPKEIMCKVEIVDCYETVYNHADIFVTCTVSKKGYIDQKPKEGALLLNISLRDFKPSILDYPCSIVVDQWEEVCRENTDIEIMHLKRNLQKENTYSMADVICRKAMKNLSKQTVMFNPMGLAIFDIAIAAHYYRLALDSGVGDQLES